MGAELDLDDLCDGNPAAKTELAELRAELTALRLYAPARRAQPTVKTAPLREPNYAFFGLVIETDEEWASRAGRQITEATE